MNVMISFHFKIASETYILNLDKMIAHGGHLKNLAREIATSEEYTFYAESEWIHDVWRTKDIRVGLPETVHKAVQVFVIYKEGA